MAAGPPDTLVADGLSEGLKWSYRQPCSLNTPGCEGDQGGQGSPAQSPHEVVDETLFSHVCGLRGAERVQTGRRRHDEG